MAVVRLPVLALAGLLSAAADGARADVTVKLRVETYDIAGASGTELLDAMDRLGPAHGFLARAMALTRYPIDWDKDWQRSGRACAAGRVDAALTIVHRFPRAVGAMPPRLARAWRRFSAGMRRHEEGHGLIARRMAKAAQRAVSGVRFPDDPDCSKAKAEAARRIAVVTAAHEAMQKRFDAREHRPGGPVERLIEALERAE